MCSEPSSARTLGVPRLQRQMGKCLVNAAGSDGRIVEFLFRCFFPGGRRGPSHEQVWNPNWEGNGGELSYMLGRVRIRRACDSMAFVTFLVPLTQATLNARHSLSHRSSRCIECRGPGRSNIQWPTRFGAGSSTVRRVTQVWSDWGNWPHGKKET